MQQQGSRGELKGDQKQYATNEYKAEKLEKEQALSDYLDQLDEEDRGEIDELRA